MILAAALLVIPVMFFFNRYSAPTMRDSGTSFSGSTTSTTGRKGFSFAQKSAPATTSDTPAVKSIFVAEKSAPEWQSAIAAITDAPTVLNLPPNIDPTVKLMMEPTFPGFHVPSRGFFM
jgi:hypothetical protein